LFSNFSKYFVLEHLGGDAESVDPAHPSRAPPARDTLL
jgi:hypothetical protein